MGGIPEIRVDGRRRMRTMLLCAVVGALLFGTAWSGLHGTAGLGLADQPVLLWMVAHRLPLLTTVMTSVTCLGSPAVIGTAVVIIAIVWMVWRRELYRPLVLVGGSCLGYALTALSKLVTANPRPAEVFMLPPIETNLSFPSGHTVGIVVLLLVLGYLLWSRRPERWSLGSWVGWAVLAGSIMACTRLYLAAHWLTDVVGSFGLALLVLAVVILVDGLVSGRRRA